MFKYILISESALDATLVSEGFSESSFLPADGANVYGYEISSELIAFRVASEQPSPSFALVGTDNLEYLTIEGGNINEIYRRIARVVKGLSSPPVHLPRQWSEYHHRNLLAFFALPRDISNVRWVVEFNANRCARFDFLSSSSAEVDLVRFSNTEWPFDINEVIDNLTAIEVQVAEGKIARALAHEVDLFAIGSISVANNYTYDEWMNKLTEKQKDILSTNFDQSITYIGASRLW